MADNKIFKISFIGGGNMATALINGLLLQGFAASSINVVEPDPQKRTQLSSELGVNVTEQLPSVSKSDVVVLAVKPQQLRDLSIFLGSLLHNQLVISVAAGIRTKDLSRWLGGYQSIVRVMPNTPAQIQKGISALFALPATSALQRQQADVIFSAAGQILWLDNEDQFNAVTAVSGSGPAYIFYFIEAMQQAGVELGLSAEQAAALSLQTFLGASQLAVQSKETVDTLRAQVTSKGGTTEQAILSMEADEIKPAIIKAMQAAAARSMELGDQLGKG